MLKVPAEGLPEGSGHRIVLELKEIVKTRFI